MICLSLSCQLPGRIKFVAQVICSSIERRRRRGRKKKGNTFDFALASHSGLCKFLAAAHMQLQFFLSLPLIKLEPLLSLSLPLAHFTQPQPQRQRQPGVEESKSQRDNYTTHTHVRGSDRIGSDRIGSGLVMAGSRESGVWAWVWLR